MTTQSIRSSQRATFVGRDEEFAVLMDVLDKASTGTGAVVIIKGEPGIGKSRLAEEMLAAAQGQGFTALAGHCHEGAGTTPYLPLIEAIEIAGDSVPGAVTGGLVRQLSSSGVVEDRDLAPEQQRYALFNAVREFMSCVSAEHPLLLIVEDLHWAGAPLILLLRHLALFVGSQRVVIAVTCREDDDDPAARLVEEARRMRGGRVIGLGPISRSSVETMIASLSGSQSPALTLAIHEQTEGNPFFVEEVIRHLIEEERLPDSDGWTASVTSDDLQVPPTVKSLIERRLVHITDETRRTLTATAAIGRTFDFQVLAAVSDADPEAILDCLDEAVRAGLILSASGSDGRLSFSHELVRQTLLSQVSAPRRQRLHLRVMQAIERQADSGDRKAELAYHALRAGGAVEAETAIEYVISAAERAVATTGYEEGARLYRYALQLAPKTDNERRCEMLLQLGAAEKHMSDSEEARAIFREAAGLARTLDDTERLARAALGVARSWPLIGEEDTEATELLRESERGLGKEPTGLRAMLLSRLAVQLLYSGQVDEVKALSAKAVDTARRSGDKVALARVLQTHHVMIWWPGRLQERLAISEEMMQISRELGIAEIALWSHRPRIADLTALGRIEEAEAELRAYIELAEAFRQPIYIWQAAIRKSMLASLRGRLGEGDRLATEAFSVGQRASGQNLTAAFGEQMLVIRHLQGRLKELEPLANAAQKAQPGLGLWRSVLAFIYAETGREAEARRELEYLSADGFTRLPKDDTRLIATVLLSVVAARLGDAAAADELYEEMAPYQGHMTILSEGVTCAGAADHYLGLLAATSRRWEMALRHFSGAAELNTKAGARPWLAMTQFEHGAMLVARRAPGDRKQAAELFQASLATARELGMAGLQARLEQILASHRGLSSQAPDGLTAREVEVLKLVASGRSNKEISEHLVLSLRTTARHVTNIYGKIGAHNRADATAYAIRQGLLSG